MCSGNMARKARVVFFISFSYIDYIGKYGSISQSSNVMLKLVEVVKCSKSVQKKEI